MTFHIPLYLRAGLTRRATVLARAITSFFILGAFLVCGQTTWSCAGTICSWPGSIGIGTTNPSAAVGVVRSGADNAANYAALEIKTTAPSPGFGPAVILNGASVGGENWQIFASGTSDGLGTATGKLVFFDRSAIAPRMVIDRHGFVGVGTTNPCSVNPPTNCRMSVAGGIQAQQVVVNTGWSDYVFDPSYRLAPLNEIAKYIEQNHHLPDVPSASEVKQKGVDVGEMESKLLAKVEELTLHMIKADERNTRLEQENRQLRDRVTKLEREK